MTCGTQRIQKTKNVMFVLGFKEVSIFGGSWATIARTTLEC